MNFSLEHIRFESISVQLDNHRVPKAKDYPQLEALIETVSEEVARMLLHLHPMMVTPEHTEGEKEQYQLLSGIPSYLLARSCLDGRRVPVMVVDKPPVLNPHMVDQLLTKPLLSMNNQRLVGAWDYWRDIAKGQLSELGKDMHLKSTEAKLIGLGDSAIRKIRADLNRGRKRSDGSGEQSDMLGELDNPQKPTGNFNW